MQHEFEEVKSHQFEDGERYKLIKQHTYTLPKKSSTCILTTSKPTQCPLLCTRCKVVIGPPLSHMYVADISETSLAVA
jgi:hypothetical protein